MPKDFAGFGVLFAIVPILIGVVFVLIIGTIANAIIKSVRQWAYNNGQPVQSVAATVVAKRTNTWGTSGTDTGGSVNTSYYATFETQDGGRQELGLSGRDYGLLVEGDRGTLSFQGTRYKGFDRSSA